MGEPEEIAEFDVFVAGSGPIGALFARQLVDAGHSVVLAEIGDHTNEPANATDRDTLVPGSHKKNEIEYQKDIDRFVRVIQGALSTVSVPTSSTIMPELDPAAWRPSDPNKQFVTNGRNTFQANHNNLGAQAVTRAVGGMTTHWTCATPEFLKRNPNPETGENPLYERPVIFEDVGQDDAEWSTLYNATRSIIGTSEKEYEHSIRHNVVLNALQKHYPRRGVKPLPLACHRLAENSPYVNWHSAENIFGDMFVNRTKKNANDVPRGKFTLLTNTRCTRLHLRNDSPSVPSINIAEVRDLLAARLADDNHGPSPGDNYYIKAKTFVVAAGAVATPQPSLWRKTHPKAKSSHSEFGALYHRAADLVEDAGNLEGKPDWWKKAVEAHRSKNKDDPLPFPFQDGEPQVTIPASYERPWHTQIHRDAFSYGEAGPRADSRVVVDLRFFGRQDGVKKNRMIFEDDLTDAYGMPQPTFEYEPSTKYAEETSSMMNDMTDVANKLGGYLPGSYPQFMTPGLALHLGGTTRLGLKEQDTVGNYDSQVWKFNNLYVGGNGLIPTAFGANPTLTSMCFAIRAANKIHTDLKNNNFTPPNEDTPVKPTPEAWVRWTSDKNDPNFPDHRNLRPPQKSI
ncbi:hypothetical protein D9758_014384 [Tetrapyrgos nigripes]|uniref:Pyranose 2-oxidase n=1 Tax=Tetrapyrgos nigripes TaxID=182062 RepID=A0A8H5CSG7_9AGAR|nr:hypothetical protein D9758_014384 [Tetrapyrgos nigripes]